MQTYATANSPGEYVVPLVSASRVRIWPKLDTPYPFDKKTPNFDQGLDFLRSQVPIYTCVHEESESEVERC